jgi:hypothetical protein
MTPEKTIISNKLTSAFVLDKTKLARIMDIIEQRLSEAEVPFAPTFDVTLSKGKHIQTVSIDQLFSFDNSISNPIKMLSIHAEGNQPEQLSCTLNFDKDPKNNIALEVTAVDSKQASQTFAELEEQVERTLSSSWIHKFTPINIFLGGAFLLMFTLIVLILISTVNSDSVSSRDGYMLSSDEEAAFAKRAKEVTNANDKIDFLFDLQSRQLERTVGQRERNSVHIGRPSVRSLFLMLPLIVILGCVVYLQQTSYPFGVFLWGDYEEYYNKLVSRRKTVWTVVVASLFVGILGNLFVFGLSSSLR